MTIGASPSVSRRESARLVLALARDEAVCVNLARLLADATAQRERRRQELVADKGPAGHRRGSAGDQAQAKEPQNVLALRRDDELSLAQNDRSDAAEPASTRARATRANSARVNHPACAPPRYFSSAS